LSILLVCALLLAGQLSWAADEPTAEGLWQPVDSSGRPLGLIRVYQEQGVYFGRIEPQPGRPPDLDRCTRCTDERKDQPIVGLVIIRNMHRQDDDEYSGGDVLDPQTGRLYQCRFRLTEDGQSMVMRGYFGLSIFGRSMTWKRVKDPK
jgi:uncharacterized protein (DUF2147 family)